GAAVERRGSALAAAAECVWGRGGCPIVWMMLHLRTIAAVALAVASGAVGRQPGPDYDFSFSTIGAVGNAPYSGPDPYPLGVDGRGQVNYTYRISRLEVTTAQWMEFVNTFSVQPELDGPKGPRLVWGPDRWWGAVPDTSYQGPGHRYTFDPGEQF